MKALIFAAGLGTRLYPITRDIPKALAKVGGKPLLEITINRLKKIGIEDVIINVHHFAGQIVDFLHSKNNFGINVSISDESDLLLDTGGGLLKTAWFFSSPEPFIVHNVDVLSDIDLQELIRFHQNNSALATLAVRKRNTSRYLMFDEKNALCGWRNNKTGDTKIIHPKENLKEMAFSGIHVIDPAIFSLIKESGTFSIIDLYLRLAKNNRISGFDHSHTYWFDLGKPENILEAEKRVSLQNI